jgi:hypothetical protein
MDVMYTEIGQVSEATIAELKTILDEVARWEHHISKVTDHQAAVCIEQCKTVAGLVDLWPVDTWSSMTFLRLGPGGKLYRHADDGFGFHIPVETNPAAVSLSFENGARAEQHLEVGKLYHVDRSIEHESFNDGETDRTHLIILLK